jgi:diguanylate cyclase (GGDEF)-like protein
MNDVDNSVLTSPDFSEFLFNNLSSAIFLVDRDMRVQKVNSTFTTLFSEAEASALGKLCGNAIGCSFAIEQNSPCGSTAACGSCDIRRACNHSFDPASPPPASSYITRDFYINGKPVTKYLRLTTRYAAWKGADFAIMVMDDITELEEQKRQIQNMANHDFLTGLKNRRHFFEIGENLFQNAKRGNLGIALAMFDIDHFKHINDAYGHAAGDFVLKAVADILERNLRKADVLARFGGEEFCLLLHCRDATDAYTVVDKMRLLVEQNTCVYETAHIHATISAGLTSVLGDTLDSMIQKADAMLYHAKEKGRNRTEEYAPEPGTAS